MIQSNDGYYISEIKKEGIYLNDGYFISEIYLNATPTSRVHFDVMFMVTSMASDLICEKMIHMSCKPAWAPLLFSSISTVMFELT